MKNSDRLYLINVCPFLVFLRRGVILFLALLAGKTNRSMLP